MTPRPPHPAGASPSPRPAPPHCPLRPGPDAPAPPVPRRASAPERGPSAPSAGPHRPRSRSLHRARLGPSALALVVPSAVVAPRARPDTDRARAPSTALASDPPRSRPTFAFAPLLPCWCSSCRVRSLRRARGLTPTALASDLSRADSLRRSSSSCRARYMRPERGLTPAAFALHLPRSRSICRVRAPSAARAYRTFRARVRSLALVDLLPRSYSSCRARYMRPERSLVPTALVLQLPRSRSVYRVRAPSAALVVELSRSRPTTALATDQSRSRPTTALATDQSRSRSCPRARVRRAERGTYAPNAALRGPRSRSVNRARAPRAALASDLSRSWTCARGRARRAERGSCDPSAAWHPPRSRSIYRGRASAITLALRVVRLRCEWCLALRVVCSRCEWCVRVASVVLACSGCWSARVESARVVYR